MRMFSSEFVGQLSFGRQMHSKPKLKMQEDHKIHLDTLLHEITMIRVVHS